MTYTLRSVCRINCFSLIKFRTLRRILGASNDQHVGNSCSGNCSIEVYRCWKCKNIMFGTVGNCVLRTVENGPIVTDLLQFLLY